MDIDSHYFHIPTGYDVAECFRLLIMEISLAVPAFRGGESVRSVDPVLQSCRLLVAQRRMTTLRSILGSMVDPTGQQAQVIVF